MKNSLKRLTALFTAILLLASCAFADTSVLRRDAVSSLLDGVGRAAISGMSNVLFTFDDADALSEELIPDYSRAVNYAIVRRMGNNLLEADKTLTRAELLSMAGWAAEAKLEEKGSSEAVFSDLPEWSVKPVSCLKAAGWLDMYEGDVLGADEPATQEELEYFADKLKALYCAVTPGESFYGYVNEEWMRAQNLPDLELDPLHGVIRDIGDKWSAANEGKSYLRAACDEVLHGIMDGSIPYEKGSAAQRFHDMMEICMQGDTDYLMISSYAEYGKDISQRVLNADSIEELLEINADIYSETGTPALIEFSQELAKDETNLAFGLKFSDVIPHLCAWIDYSGQKGAVNGTVQYLRKAGRIFGIELTAQEAEALYDYCAMVLGGRADELFGQFAKYHLTELATGAMGFEMLEPVFDAHPELNAETRTYNEGCSPNCYMSLSEVYAAYPGLHLDELFEKTGFAAAEYVYVYDPAVLSAAEAFFGNADNINAVRLLILASLCYKQPFRMDADFTSFYEESEDYLVKAYNLDLEDDAAYCEMVISDIEDNNPSEGIVSDEYMFGGLADSKSSFEDALMFIERNCMPEIVGEVFADYCMTEEAVSDVERMVAMIIDGYIERFSNNTWMDESTRAAAIKKLENMRVFVSFPKGKYVPEIVPASEGGTFASNFFACSKNDLKRFAAICTEPDYRYLYGESKANEVNAGYNYRLNAFYVLAGIIQKPYYDADKSFAWNLGAIGSVVAHEIGHAFDGEGALYDETGAENKWWTEKDAAEFENRKAQFIEYYNRFMITGGQFQDGEISLSENMADFAGMRVIMDVLEGDPEAQKEALLGFASVSAELLPQALKESDYSTSDVHSANNVRVDAVVASLDEFYDLFGIDESDAMYVAPEERLKLW